MKTSNTELIALLSAVLVTLAGWTLLIASLAHGFAHALVV